MAAMLKHDAGVLCAPTAFGKTVSAAAIIARRGVNTLVLVHRTELLKQWQERLQAFLGQGNKADKGVIGTIGGGKSKPSGKIDIAVMQSLSRQGEVNALVENYGQIVVDECHHVGAASFDAILKRSRAKYVLGLTATPIRRDGQQPIIFMQCGPIRHTAARPASAPHDLEVVPRSRFARIDLPATAGIQDVFRHLANDLARTQAIAAEAVAAFGQGRKILVLTERTEHLDAIHQALTAQALPPFVLHGRMSKKQRSALITALDALPPEAPRILLATGKLVGEGFDHPPLDTLVLAMPVSWKCTLQQYAGRLHREHASKTDVRIIDFVDTGHPALLRMWEKRQRGYRAMGYRVSVDASSEDQSSVDDGALRLAPLERIHAGQAAAAWANRSTTSRASTCWWAATRAARAPCCRPWPSGSSASTSSTVPSAPAAPAFRSCCRTSLRCHRRSSGVCRKPANRGSGVSCRSGASAGSSRQVLDSQGLPGLASKLQ